MKQRALGLWLVSVVLLASLQASACAAAKVEKQTDGALLAINDGFLKLEVCADDVIRVAFAKDRDFFAKRSLAAEPKRCNQVEWRLAEGRGEAVLSTQKLRVRVDLASGALQFLDASGRPILSETKGGRTMSPAEVQGEKTFHVRQQWEPGADESLYGLGQHQLGLMDIKGYDIDLWQHNGTVIVPFLVSSRGYGIFWDNTSYTRFGDLRPFEPIPPERLIDASGKTGGLTGSYFAGDHFDRLVATRMDPKIDIQLPGDERQPNPKIHPDLPPGNISIRWEGQIAPASSGEYLLQTLSNNGVKVWIDNQLVINHWRQGWLPWIDIAKVRLEANRRYPIRVEWTKEQGMETMRLFWKTPAASSATSLWSEVGDGIDYYFVYGPEIDRVIAGYRRITGQAPMMPIWAFGLWQSRQRYETAKQSLDVVDGFRSRRIPFDNIVQDWFYWKEDAWGSHQFDPKRFPDPVGWIKAIHDRHARIMISVWPKFYPGAENFKAMHDRGFLYESNLKAGIKDWIGYPDTFYDAFNAQGRKLFWSQVERELFSKGIDAWWLDATEPDLLPTPTLEGQRAFVHPTALGTGARVLNAYSLENSKGFYEGLRSAAPNQRVFILTRSGFAGQQRYSAATWSGDITSTWTAMRQQIAAGLGFTISGIPYWTQDIGGFSAPGRFQARPAPKPEDAEEWRELNARWFEFGTFTPLLRVHGEYPYREMWQLGGESHPAYQAELKFDRLRYRMLPYIYSLASQVTEQAGTMMRALVMDFREDVTAREIADQYMFGPAFLVSPVTTYKARVRSVYLPQAAGWYDFWTGAFLPSGQVIEAGAPYDAMPVHVRAGSIIPFGPELQYTTEKPADPITLYVYSGADGAFTLYEDDGLTYDYQKGALAEIPIRWSEATRTLTVGARQGSFPGMLAERTFEVVLVSKAKPVGFSFTPKPDQTLRYKGEEVKAQLK
jgi:alpha-D-xyloside xylohydrolase